MFSRDYGGSAKVKAVATIHGVNIQATVQETGEKFARIPIDRCGPTSGCDDGDGFGNGIPDVWEKSISPDRYLDPYEDSETGSGGANSNVVGDGYTAHDEYRGFITWDGTNYAFRRTDPRNTKDVFFYDNTSLATYTALSNPVRKAVASILAPATQPWFQFIEVGPRVFMFMPALQAGRADVNNRAGCSTTANLPTAGCPPALQAQYVPVSTYPLLYTNASLNDPLPPTCSGNQVFLGNSYNFLSDGTPIRLDPAALQLCAGNGTLASPGLPLDVEVAVTIAHETGHKLTDFHPTSCRPVVNVLANDLAGIKNAVPNANVGQRDPLTLLPWLRSYTYLAIRQVGDLPGDNGLKVDMSQTVPLEDLDYAIWNVALSNPFTLTSANIKLLNGFIMDYTSKLTLRTPQDFAFDPADLATLCPVAFGCGRPPLPANCPSN